MREDDEFDERERNGYRDSRPFGAGGRGRGGRGAGRGLFDLGMFDQVLRDVTSWFDAVVDEDPPGRRGPVRRARRHAGAADPAEGFAGTAADGVSGGHPRAAPDEVPADDYADEDGARADSQRGRGPKNYRRSDKRLKELVSDALYDDERLDASDVEVSVDDGEIRLSGFVDARRDKHRAENVAARVSGAPDVDNRLRVRRGARGSGATSPGGRPRGMPGDAARDADDYGHSG